MDAHTRRSLADLRAHAGDIVRGGSGGNLLIVRPTGDPCPGIGSECDCVQAEVIFNPCGGEPAPGTIVNMWSFGGQQLNYPPEILYETSFWAGNMGNSLGNIVFPGGAYGYDEAPPCVVIALMPVGLCVESQLYGST